MNYNYYPISEDGQAITSAELIKKELEKEGYKKKEHKSGITYKYNCGDITLKEMEKNSSPLITISPKGLMGKTIDKNHRTLIRIVESHEIKLILDI